MKLGVFDSGLGGLTVVKEIQKILPNETILYFGDNQRCPYGSKETKKIQSYVDEIVDFLLKKEIKLLVIACNTVTALYIDELRKKIAIPVVGVIEPGATHALKVTKNKKVGVIATEKTIETNAYEKTIKKLSTKTIDVLSVATPLLVPMIEKESLKEIEKKIIDQSLFPIRNSDIDTLILGCTHYPLIKQEIKACVGEAVALIDPSIETAKKVKEVLEKENLLSFEKEEEDIFYTTGEKELFRQKAEKWFQKSLHIKQVLLQEMKI